MESFLLDGLKNKKSFYFFKVDLKCQRELEPWASIFYVLMDVLFMGVKTKFNRIGAWTRNHLWAQEICLWNWMPLFPAYGPLWRLWVGYTLPSTSHCCLCPWLSGFQFYLFDIRKKGWQKALQIHEVYPLIFYCVTVISIINQLIIITKLLLLNYFWSPSPLFFPSSFFFLLFLPPSFPPFLPSFIPSLLSDRGTQELKILAVVIGNRLK